MKNVSLDCTTVLQLYTHGSDGAFNAAADYDSLGNHAAIDRCAIADQEIGSAHLAVGSGPDATCSTSACDSSTVLSMSASAFAAVLLSCSAALLLKLPNM